MRYDGGTMTDDLTAAIDAAIDAAVAAINGCWDDSADDQGALPTVGDFAAAAVAAAEPILRRAWAEQAAKAIEADLVGDLACEWTKTEAIATIRDYGEADA